MKLFITSGTLPYLLTMMQDHSEEQLLLLQKDQSTLLLHETDNDSFFKSPRKYQVISQKGTFTQKGFVVMYNIPVNPEKQPVFEHAYTERLKQLDSQPGLIAYRFLKPLGPDSYIILTHWLEENAFKAWQNSASYISANDLKLPTASAQKLFTGNPYTSKYSVPKIE